MEVVAGQTPVDHFNPGHLDDAVPQIGVQAGGFGIQNDLPNFKNPNFYNQLSTD
jgi:hypothetical protein